MNQAGEDGAAPGWRVRTGLVLFVASVCWPLFLPVLPLLGLSGATIAAVSGAMLVVAELLILAGAALAGKEGFAYIKGRILGLLRDWGPPQRVGATRHRIGLVMFVVPLLAGWAAPYLGRHVPGYPEHAFAVAVALDALLLASLFVLGGEFWDKLRALFRHDRAPSDR